MVDPLFHYTTLDNFSNMLKGKHDSPEKRHLNFWASSTYCMDDQTEMNFGYPLIMEVLNHFEKNQNLTPKQRLSDIVTILPRLITGPCTDVFLPKSKIPYSISFSRAYNSKYMWNHYGESGYGLCLCFDADKLVVEASQQIGTYLLDIAYLEVKDHDLEIWKSIVELIIEQACQCHIIAPILKYENDIPRYKEVLLNSLCPVISALIKSSQFSQEEEVRWICIRDKENAQCRKRPNGQIVEFIEIQIPIDSLIGIIPGPHFKKEIELKKICKENNIVLTNEEIKRI